MHSIVEWVKDHPYLTGGVALALVVLYAITRSSGSSSSSQPQVIQTGPDDTISAMEIQAGAASQAAAYSAQTQLAGDNAAVSLAGIQAGGQLETNLSGNQAALTLGLANAGQGTQSILELLAAQPGSSVSPALINVSGVGPSSPTSTTSITPSGPISQIHSDPGSAPVTSTGPNPNSGIGNQPIMPVQPVAIASSPADPGSHGSIADLYESNVNGLDEMTGQPYPVNSQYYASPAANSAFASIVGAPQGSIVPGGVGTVGGPFIQPGAGAVYVNAGAPTPTGAGLVDTGQILAGLQHTAPGTWATQLAGYGISLTPAMESQIYQMFGSNQAVPPGFNTVPESAGTINEVG